jgi:hypothetical protein
MYLISSPFFLDNGRNLSVHNQRNAFRKYKQRAEVAELVDALGSGSSGGFSVPVQIRASAPDIYIDNINWRLLIVIYILLAGVWGTLIKVASDRLNPLITSFIATTTQRRNISLFVF